MARRSHEAPEVHQITHCGQHLEVALQVGADIAVKPQRTGTRIVERQRRRGVAPLAHRLTPVRMSIVLAFDDARPFGHRRRQQGRPDARTAPPKPFPPGERPEIDVGRATGQRLRDPPHHQQVRRGGEHEATAAAWSVVVHRALHTHEQIRITLYFVQRQPQCAPDQFVGRLARLFLHIRVVEREIAVLRKSGFGLHERALAGLPGTHDHDHRRDFKRSGEQLGGVTRYVGHIAHGCGNSLMAVAIIAHAPGNSQRTMSCASCGKPLRCRASRRQDRQASVVIGCAAGQ